MARLIGLRAAARLTGGGEAATAAPAAPDERVSPSRTLLIDDLARTAAAPAPCAASAAALPRAPAPCPASAAPQPRCATATLSPSRGSAAAVPPLQPAEPPPRRAAATASPPPPPPAVLVSPRRFATEFSEARSWLGRGGQGVVVGAASTQDGRRYAVKRVALGADPAHALAEVRAMALLPPHANVVQLHSSWIEDGTTAAAASTAAAGGGGLRALLGDDAAAAAGGGLRALLDGSGSRSSSPSRAVGGLRALLDVSLPSPPSSGSDDDDYDDDGSSGFDSSDDLDELPAAAPRARRHRSRRSGPRRVLHLQLQLCGQTLRTLLRRPQRRPGGAADIFAQLCDAVAHCHAHGVAHRDVKPDNVYETRSGGWALGDFGLARVLSDHPDGGVGGGVGTCLYAAALGGTPESADVFSLGVVLCELLVPFGTAMERALCLSALPSRRAWRDCPGVDPGSLSVVGLACARDPARRPTAAEAGRMVRLRGGRFGPWVQ